MFASRITATVSLADDHSVTIRKLSATTLDKARDARSADQAKTLRNYGGDILKAIRSEEVNTAAAAKPEVKVDAKVAHYATFDRELVLNAGIVSWTVPEKVNPDNVSDLDEPSAKAIFEAIIDLSSPVSAAVEEKG